MAHLELYHHFITGGNFFSFAPPELAAIMKEKILKHSIQTPYLMHQLLAISARHLSTESTDKKGCYFNQAIQLQSHALTLFDSVDLGTSSPVRPEHHISVLCFSDMLGTHALCDALWHLGELTSQMKSQRDVLLAFLVRFVDCMRLHRGVNNVVMASWDFYFLSELRPVVQYCWQISQRQPTGHETDGLRARVSALEGLSPEVLAACLKAIDGIQIAIDVGNDSTTGTCHPEYLLIWWSLYVPSEFIDALSTGLPDLVAILAYYAVILHRSRLFRFVGSAGTQLLQLLTAHLGPSYAATLAYPRKELGLGRVETVYDAVRGWTERSSPDTRSAQAPPGQQGPAQVSGLPLA